MATQVNTPQPAADEADSTNGTAPAETPSEAKPERHQLGDIIDVNISTARLRTTLSKFGINERIHNLISEVKESDSVQFSQDVKNVLATTSLKPDSPDKNIADLAVGDNVEKLSTMKLDDVKKSVARVLGRHILRVGEDAIVAFASTVNYIIVRLVEHGVVTLASEKKKTLKPHHIANDGLKDIDIWYFIRDLDCVKTELARSEERALEIIRKKEARKAKNKKKSGKKNNAKKADVPDTATEQIQSTQVCGVGTPSGDKSDEKKSVGRDPRNGFRHHVFGIASKLVKGAVDGDVSNNVRTFGSHVVYELCQRFSSMIKVLTAYAKVKTIKSVTITSINSLITSDSSVDYDRFNDYVSSRIKMYENHKESSS